MKPHDACSIPIHVCTVTLVDISHEKRSKTPFSNEHEIKSPNTIIQLWKTFMWNLRSDVNNTPKTNNAILKDRSINWRR